MATSDCKPENKYPPHPCPCPEIPGPQGIPGPLGLQGPQGDPGSIGPQGEPGECDCPPFNVRITGAQGPDSIALTASPIGGTGPFTYLWVISSTYMQGGGITASELTLLSSPFDSQTQNVIASGVPTLFGEGVVSCEVTDTVTGVVAIGYHYVKFTLQD